MSHSPGILGGRDLGTCLPNRSGFLAESSVESLLSSGLRAGFWPRSAPRLLWTAPKHRGTVCASAGGLGGGANGPIPPDPGTCENLFCLPLASQVIKSLTRVVMRLPWALSALLPLD